MAGDTGALGGLPRDPVLVGLREVDDGDWWALTALIAACWAEYPGCVTDVAGEYPELLAPATHTHEVGGRLWVLPEGAWVAACVGLSPGAVQPVELVKLYVARHRRRGGLGRALVGWTERAARALGATGIELWSDSRFTDAHRLYQRCGWRPTGSTRDLHDRSQTTELHFEKLLSGSAEP